MGDEVVVELAAVVDGRWERGAVVMAAGCEVSCARGREMAGLRGAEEGEGAVSWDAHDSVGHEVGDA